MSRTLLIPPALPRHAQDVAAAEVALALRRPWLAETPARRALT